MEEPADGHDENMHSSSQVAVAAVDLSYTEGSEVDILDVSIQNLSIHGKFVFNTFLVTLFSHFPPGLTPCWITNLAELSLPPSPFSPRVARVLIFSGFPQFRSLQSSASIPCLVCLMMSKLRLVYS